jgi:hypothetical protein
MRDVPSRVGKLDKSSSAMCWKLIPSCCKFFNVAFPSLCISGFVGKELMAILCSYRRYVEDSIGDQCFLCSLRNA